MSSSLSYSITYWPHDHPITINRDFTIFSVRHNFTILSVRHNFISRLYLGARYCLALRGKWQCLASIQDGKWFRSIVFQSEQAYGVPVWLCLINYVIDEIGKEGKQDRKRKNHGRFDYIELWYRRLVTGVAWTTGAWTTGDWTIFASILLPRFLGGGGRGEEYSYTCVW